MYLLCAWICVKAREKLVDLLSPSTMWDSGMELKSSGLVVGAFSTEQSH